MLAVSMFAFSVTAAAKERQWQTATVREIESRRANGMYTFNTLAYRIAVGERLITILDIAPTVFNGVPKAFLKLKQEVPVSVEKKNVRLKLPDGSERKLRIGSEVSR
jgi:hypothetical protein